MPRSTSKRRVLAASAAGGLAAALAWLPAGPASANVLAQFSAVGSASADYTGPVLTGECTLRTGDDENPSNPTGTFSSGTRTKAVDLSATYTNSEDPTDVTHAFGHYKGSVTIKKHKGDLKSLLMGGKGQAEVRRALGSASQCDTSAQIGIVLQSQFTEHKKGWLYVNRTTGDKFLETVLLVADDAGNPVTFEIYAGGPSNASSRAFLTPGTYQVPQAALVAIAGNDGIFLKAPMTSRLSAKFFRAGSALTSTKGSGKSYVGFPGSVTCGTHKATLRWKDKASKVAAGSFFVNGKKKVTDSTPRGGEKIVLKHLKPRADVKITAKLHLKGGGSATATRSYVPCKA